MARSLRHNREGGWYHITTRGVGRQRIFLDERDRGRFVELLSETVVRYGVRVHAYVLMENHYHLLMETPGANASRALQWLNLSYSVWHNRRHGRSGALFQARFRSVPVDRDGSWALAASVYLHLNPVRIRALGQGKRDRAAGREGMSGPVPAVVLLQRLDRLRGHVWSSYPVYAGYRPRPGWLTCSVLWAQAARKGMRETEGYRAYVEDYVKQGAEEGVLRRLTAALAIGSTAFVEGLRKRLPQRPGEQSDVRKWRRLLPFETVKAAVAKVKGEPWERFVERRRDPGRDLALHYARTRGGYTLRELGAFTDNGTFAVSKAISRIGRRLAVDRSLRRLYARIETEVETDPQ
jgi:REP element-mobilizing transposase RayT